MNALKRVLSEIYGLFVDDVAFAVSILAWLGLIWLLVVQVQIRAALAGILLVMGLGCILLESAVRFARRKRSEIDRTSRS